MVLSDQYPEKPESRAVVCGKGHCGGTRGIGRERDVIRPDAEARRFLENRRGQGRPADVQLDGARIRSSGEAPSRRFDDLQRLVPRNRGEFLDDATRLLDTHDGGARAISETEMGQELLGTAGGRVARHLAQLPEVPAPDGRAHSELGADAVAIRRRSDEPNLQPVIAVGAAAVEVVSRRHGVPAGQHKIRESVAVEVTPGRRGGSISIGLEIAHFDELKGSVAATSVQGVGERESGVGHVGEGLSFEGPLSGGSGRTSRESNVAVDGYHRSRRGDSRVLRHDEDLVGRDIHQGLYIAGRPFDTYLVGASRVAQTEGGPEIVLPYRGAADLAHLLKRLSRDRGSDSDDGSDAVGVSTRAPQAELQPVMTVAETAEESGAALGRDFA